MTAATRSVALRKLAHARSGDKGRTLNVAVIAFDPGAFDCIAEQLTVDAFADWHRGLFDGPVKRYAVARLGTLNFVCEGALGGGVSRNLCLDNYGKALASRVLEFPVKIPALPEFALREPGPDPLLAYLQSAGIDARTLQDTPWARALFPRRGGDGQSPGRSSVPTRPNEETAGRTSQDPTLNWRNAR